MATSYPIGLLTRSEAESIAGHMQSLLSNGGNTYALWSNSKAPDNFSDWNALRMGLLDENTSTDAAVVIVINDTQVPLVLNGDPTMTYGYYEGGPPQTGSPARETIPPSVEGMPTIGYFSLRRSVASATGILGAFSLSPQSPDVPKGITLGFQSGGDSSFTLQCAAIEGMSASSCADDLGNSKFSTFSTFSSNNLTVSAGVQGSEGVVGSGIYEYYMLVYVRCAHSA